jgi:hypothetical protein
MRIPLVAAQARKHRRKSSLLLPKYEIEAWGSEDFLKSITRQNGNR